MSLVKETVMLLVSRRWWWVTIVVILGMMVLARLGFWQLDRLEERRAANAILEQQLASEPLSLNDVDLASTDLTAMPDRSVTATGEFDFSQQIMLRVQNFQGSAGAHLVAPLRLEGRDEAVLVDRGWIPEALQTPENWPTFDEPGTVTVQGIIRLTETARNVEPPSQPQSEWFRIDVEAIERQMPYELLPIYVLQSPPPGGNQELPYREQPTFDLSEGPHLGYAIQWFAFTLMLGGGYIYFVHHQEKEAGAARAPDEVHQN